MHSHVFVFQKASAAEDRLEKLWSLYGSGALESLDREIFVVCDYEDRLSEISGILKRRLPANLYENFRRANRAYDTENEDIIREASNDYFWQHKPELIAVLQAYDDRMQ